MRRVLALAGALLVAGCGKAIEFAGDPEIPDGYATYSGQGFSFAHPKLPQKADDEVLTFGDRAAFVELRVRTDEPDFEDYVHSYVTIAESVGNAEVETTRQEVPRAQDARLLEITSPPKAGANEKELSSRVLIVDRGDDVILLAAGTQEGSEEKVDADAVISSFRLR
jgi:hypothetical protein